MTTTTSEVLAPPTERYTILGWLKRNLFGSVGDSALTIVAAWITFAMLKPTLAWGFGEASWSVIADNLKLFMVGRYPAEELWRLGAYPNKSRFSSFVNVARSWSAPEISKSHRYR